MSKVNTTADDAEKEMKEKIQEKKRQENLKKKEDSS